jgi:glucose/arabinose dehydrogenase
MAWHRHSGVLWVVDESDGGSPRLTAVVDARPNRALAQPVFALPAGPDVTALALYDDEAVPALRGSLLVAGGRSGGMWRLRIDPLDPERIAGAERLLQEAGGVEAIAVAPGGSVYFCSPRRVARLVPEGQ